MTEEQAILERELITMKKSLLETMLKYKQVLVEQTALMRRATDALDLLSAKRELAIKDLRMILSEDKSGYVASAIKHLGGTV